MSLYYIIGKQEQYTECKVAIMTIMGRKKRVLKYINHRNKTQKKLIVGPRGGISYKSPNSKSRRYVRKQCETLKSSGTFWNEVERQVKIKNKK